MDDGTQWGGDVVVIKADGGDSSAYLNRMGKANSVETLVIDSRALADNESVAQTIRHAEMLWIGGGKQSDYRKFWRNTKTMDAINYLINEKHAPVGGSSAGCAILSNIYFSAENGSATSEKSLLDPYVSDITIRNNDFLHMPYLQHEINDMHYLTRSRQGRHVAFLSRIIKDWGIFPQGIATDEHTAVCIDDKGIATVYGGSKAYFLLTDPAKAPEVCEKGRPLTWNRDHKAIRVYEIQASESGHGSFDMATLDPTKAKGGQWYWWWVENGVLHQDAAP